MYETGTNNCLTFLFKKVTVMIHQLQKIFRDSFSFHQLLFFVLTNHCSSRLTFCLAGLGNRVHLITFIAFTLKIPLVVNADLAAGVWVLTLVNVCREKRQDELSINWERHSQWLIHPHELHSTTKFSKWKLFLEHNGCNGWVNMHIYNCQSWRKTQTCRHWQLTGGKKSRARQGVSLSTSLSCFLLAHLGLSSSGVMGKR